ncbi:MAG: methyltransferase domain-containing protein [Verrucomicrobia bacterium]|nr:methyltransferase domain-containing protein [Verrucomicrobiota bacterium]
MAEIIELDAAHYQNHSASQYSQARQLLDLVDIQRSFSVLDVGCGHGNIVAEISKLAPNGKAIGIDASQNMISLAKTKFSREKFPNLSFIQLPAEEMSFPERSFDLIICTNALMWIRKPQRVLEYMCSLLKPNGQIVIFTYPKTTPYAKLFEKVLRSFLPHLVNKSAIKTMLSPKEHKTIFLNQGLEILLLRLDDIVFSYENEVDFKDYVRGWLSCYAPIPDKLQNAFLDKICEQARRDGYCDNTGRFSIPHQALRIVAKNFTV